VNEQPSNPSRPAVRLLTGLRRFLFGAAGISFFVGGGLIHAETKMDRFSAELVGLGIAAVCIFFGIVAGALADNLDTSGEDPSTPSSN